MPAETIDELRAELVLAKAARVKVLQSQAYSLGERRNQRAQLDMIEVVIDKLVQKINRMESAASGGRGRLRFGMPG